MLTFAISVFLLIITPGPGVLSTAGFGAAYGFKQSLRYVFGLFLGTNLVFLAVASGLIAVLLSVPSLRIFLLVLSTCYLLYLASKIALAGSNIAFIKAKAPPGIASGVLLQAINPKAYVVNTTFVSGFAFYQESFAIELIIKFFTATSNVLKRIRYSKRGIHWSRDFFLPFSHIVVHSTYIHHTAIFLSSVGRL